MSPTWRKVEWFRTGLATIRSKSDFGRERFKMIESFEIRGFAFLLNQLEDPIPETERYPGRPLSPPRQRPSTAIKVQSASLPVN